MMRRALAVAERLAEARRRRIIGQLATQFSDMQIEAEEARLVVRGKGLIRRWLIDPELRFLDGDWR
jgi:fructose-1,6-bisphosphatase/inositol monophosphatase family enzyme